MFYKIASRGVKSGSYLNTPDDPFRFIRCQYCGFPVDTKRHKLSESSCVLYNMESYLFPLSLEQYGDILTEDFHSICKEQDTLYDVISHEDSASVECEDGEPLVHEIHYFPSFSIPVNNCPFCGAQYTRK